MSIKNIYTTPMKEIMIQDVEKLLLIGPSSRIQSFNNKRFIQYRDEGYKLLCFTGAVSYLNGLQIQPDYFSFIDPNTFNVHYDIFTNNKTTFFSNTTLLIADLYDNNMKRFYEHNFTCNSFKKNKKRFEQFTALEFLDNFSSVYKKIPDTSQSIVKKEIPYYDYGKQFVLYNGERKINIDKFSCFLLPMVLNYFIDLTTISCIGFGDFDVGRYSHGHTKGYEEYKKSFSTVLLNLKTNLAQRKIDIDFAHDNFYSKHF